MQSCRQRALWINIGLLHFATASMVRDPISFCKGGGGKAGVGEGEGECQSQKI